MNTVNAVERNGVGNGKGGRRFIAFVCKKIYDLIAIPSIFSLSSSDYVPEEDLPIEVDREGQFSAYVHNRMNVLMIWIQHRTTVKELQAAKQHLSYFLYDMEHHFVDSLADKRIRDAFRWIRRFIKVYPAVFEKDRSQRAYEMVARIYEGLDIEFKPAKPVSGFEMLRKAGGEASDFSLAKSMDEPIQGNAKGKDCCPGPADLNRILYEHKPMPSVEQELYTFFKRDLERSFVERRTSHEKENTQNHKLAS